MSKDWFISFHLISAIWLLDVCGCRHVTSYKRTSSNHHWKLNFWNREHMANLTRHAKEGRTNNNKSTISIHSILHLRNLICKKMSLILSLTRLKVDCAPNPSKSWKISFSSFDTYKLHILFAQSLSNLDLVRLNFNWDEFVDSFVSSLFTLFYHFHQVVKVKSQFLVIIPNLKWAIHRLTTGPTCLQFVLIWNQNSRSEDSCFCLN